MSNETTLFAHIVPWLTDNIEDVAVEALGYILSNSEAARTALADAVKDGGVRVGPIDRVETWEIGDEGAIPDLVCFDGDDSQNLLIEAKFWAGLTKNQPNQYIKQLQENRQNRPAVLLFVAPRARLELLWPELCDRARKEFKVCTISNSGLVRSASVESDLHHLQLISWGALLERMGKAACGVEDKVATADIRQLRGLTDRMDGGTYLPIRPEELSSKSAYHMLDLAQLIDDATDYGKQNLWISTEGARATPHRRGYGRFVHIGGVGTWFGIHTEGWARHSDTPLWLSFHETNRDHLTRTELDKNCFELEGRYCIPIDVPKAENYHEVLNAVVNSLRNFAKRFDASVPDTSERIDSDFHRQWHHETVGPKFAEQMLSIAQIVDDVARRAVYRADEIGGNWANTDGLKKIIHPRREGYGRFIRIGGVKAWLGIHYGAWAEHSDTPLWLAFNHNERARLDNISVAKHEVYWRPCIPIDVPATAERDEELDCVVASLKNIADQLIASDA